MHDRIWNTNRRCWTLLLTLCVLALCLPLTASAEEKQAPKAVKAAAPETGSEAEEAADDRVPVFVQYGDQDPLGGRLAFAVKEAFRDSKGFRLVKSGEKALVLRLDSKVEFADRAHLGSGYSVVWVYAESSAVLSYYLESTMDFVDSETLDRTAENLVVSTDKLVGRYSYLFE